MARVKSNKYQGVYKNELNNGDISYYITYKNNNNKLVWVNIGKKSNGINENFAFSKRSEYINKIKINDDPLKHKKKKNILTLQNVADKYFESLTLSSNEKVIKDLLSKYNKHLKRFHNNDITAISTTDIEALQLSLSSNYSPKTNNMIVDLFGAIFNYGLKKEFYNLSNPASKVKRLSIDNKRERFLSEEEIKLLLQEVSNNSMLNLFVNIALSTGARLGSILSLTKKNINLHDKQIKLKDFKNNKTYTGFMTSDTYELLKQNMVELKPDDYIVSLNCTKLTERQLQCRLKPIIDKLFNQDLESNDRINRVVIHTLRHTFASHLAIKGISQFKIQTLMNHRKADMTERYTKLAPDSGKIEVGELYK